MTQLTFLKTDLLSSRKHLKSIESQPNLPRIQIYTDLYESAESSHRRASPGKRQELEHQQVAAERGGVFAVRVKGHGLRGVQDLRRLPVAVHDVGEAGGVEVGQRAPGAGGAGAGGGGGGGGGGC